MNRRAFFQRSFGALAGLLGIGGLVNKTYGQSPIIDVLREEIKTFDFQPPKPPGTMWFVHWGLDKVHLIQPTGRTWSASFVDDSGNMLIRDENGWMRYVDSKLEDCPV